MGERSESRVAILASLQERSTTCESARKRPMNKCHHESVTFFLDETNSIDVISEGEKHRKFLRRTAATYKPITWPSFMSQVTPSQL